MVIISCHSSFQWARNLSSITQLVGERRGHIILGEEISGHKEGTVTAPGLSRGQTGHGTIIIRDTAQSVKR